MIHLRDVSYVRLGTPDIENAERFATDVLGLQIGDRSAKSLYLRSDARAHTLCYVEGDPSDQTVGFEIDDLTQLDAAAAALDQLGHAVKAGTRTRLRRARSRHSSPSRTRPGTASNSSLGPPIAARDITAPGTPAFPVSVTSASIRPIRCVTRSSGPPSAMRGSAIGSAISR